VSITKRRRPGRARVLVATAAVLLTGSGCSATASQPGPPGGATTAPTTITWYAGSIGQHQNDYRQAFIDAFETANPTIKVTLESAPVDTDANRAQLLEELKGPNGPDVYVGDFIWPAQFAQEHVALPLDDLFDQAFWNRIDPALLPTVRYQNRTYGVPLFQDQGLLYYRTDLVPTPPTTWAQLEQDAVVLLQANRVSYGYLWQGDAFEGLTCIWTELIADAHASVLDLSGQPDLHSPAATMALNLLQNFVGRGADPPPVAITPPQVTTYEDTDTTTLFASGQAAFLRGWNTVLPRMGGPISSNVGVAPLPSFAPNEPGYSTTGGWSLMVNPRTHNLAAVKTFISWMTDVQAQDILVSLSQIPTNQQVRATVANEPRSTQNVAIQMGLKANVVARPAGSPAYQAISREMYSYVNSSLRTSLH
jgi:multiple sugar transport system substrate-binding protein